MTLSPLVAIYSSTDDLFGSTTRHWGGFNRTLTGLLRVDGTTYVFLGDGLRMGISSGFRYPTQTQRVISATTSRYQFVAGGVELNFSAATPALGTDYDLLSQPGSYFTLAIRSLDGAPHAISVMLSHTGEAVTGSWDTLVKWDRSSQGDLVALRIGAAVQAPLVRMGDNRMLTWGYAMLLASSAPPASGVNTSTSAALGGHVPLHAYFAATGGLPPSDAPCPPSGGQVGFNPTNGSLSYPTAAAAWSWGALRPQDGIVSVEAFLCVDELFSLEYYGVRLQPYWRRTLDPTDTTTVPWGMLSQAWAQRGGATGAAAEFDARYAASFAGVAGDDDGGALVGFANAVYRQVLSQTVLVWHPVKLAPWHVMREGAGDISTVDVMFPASPLFLLVAPRLLAAQLLPILEYCSNMTNSSYPLPYAMHDLGEWPIADLRWDHQESMPIEETANMLIMASAVGARTAWDVSFLAPYWPTITVWGEYLMRNLPFPEQQLTTDDFAGVQTNSSGLALKGAIGVAAYGQLLNAWGDEAGAEVAWEAAAEFAWVWTQNGWYADPDAPDGKGTAAHATREYLFNEDGRTGWSMPYNALWLRVLRLDGLLGVDQAYYLNQSCAWLLATQAPLSEYGIPLLAGLEGTKTDWSAWMAAMAYTQPLAAAGSLSAAERLGQGIAAPLPSALSNYIFKGIMRAAAVRESAAGGAVAGTFAGQYGLPFSDYYSVQNGTEWFWGRAVVGAVAAPLLVVQAESEVELALPGPEAPADGAARARLAAGAARMSAAFKRGFARRGGKRYGS